MQAGGDEAAKQELVRNDTILIKVSIYRQLLLIHPSYQHLAIDLIWLQIFFQTSIWCFYPFKPLLLVTKYVICYFHLLRKLINHRQP